MNSATLTNKQIVEDLELAFKDADTSCPELLFNCSNDQDKYLEKCKVFNTRFHKRPIAIVMAENAEQVSVVVKFISNHKLNLRVRSGGHDHEAECIATKAIVIDLEKMNKVDYVRENGKIAVAKIQPGNIFEKLTSELADSDVMIPHGTCATVGIAGFTLGGGWGPWTRKMGMCCEHLVGATVVLGNGDIVDVELNHDTEGKALLWALKGGGGFSYGIVTEFRIKVFPLPDTLIKFEVHWNEHDYDTQNKKFITQKDYPTIEVLKAWENIIANTEEETINLLGTNLKVMAKPMDSEEEFDYKNEVHNCVMYGYWQGEKPALEAFLKKWFTKVSKFKVAYSEEAGRDHDAKDLAYGANLMDSWDRYSLSHFQYIQERAETRDSGLLQGTPLPPDDDQPAPHKITSRLTDQQGLGEEGYKQLIKSLTSPLVLEGNLKLGLFQYITLGAIVGHYYTNISLEQKSQSAFPYKDKLYTIQYQTWWNESDKEKGEESNNKVYNRVNRALDWMEVCRDFDIPNTSGAFISFKDGSVPTKTYFAQNYEALIKVKEDQSKDPYNHFRTRKTII